MSVERWNPPAPDAQMIAEAQLEDTLRSIVEWRDVPGTRTTLGLDRNGEVLVRSCGRGERARDRDPNLLAQDVIETGSQDLGFDDEWA